jgi:hypothetical protein
MKDNLKTLKTKIMEGIEDYVDTVIIESLNNSVEELKGVLVNLNAKSEIDLPLDNPNKPSIESEKDKNKVISAKGLPLLTQSENSKKKAKTNKNNRKTTLEQIRTIKKFAEEGKTDKEISEIVGIAPPNVNYWRRNTPKDFNV